MSLDTAIQRIAIMHRPKKGWIEHYGAIEEYTICDYDKTDWPCATERILTEEVEGWIGQ